LLIAWVGVTTSLLYYVQRELTISGDLRLFMPSPQTRIERLLLEEVGESPASRLLLLALDGANAETLAYSSQELVAALRNDQAFGLVANGATAPDAIPESLLPYRYLLSSTLDAHRLDADFLRGELKERLRDLASPAAALLEEWIPRDPTLEVVELAEQWQPAQQPQRLYEVWFDGAGDTALLVAESKAAAFDPEAQRGVLNALQRHFQATRAGPRITLTVSGPGAFSVLMKETTQREAQWLGALATIGMIVLLLFAYRKPSLVVLGTLPIASAGIAGLAAVSAVFGQVHGITLAFGFTLIGVAQDYPMHLFSHQRLGKPLLATARAVWPTLATGIVSTCIAYLAFLRSGVVGLQQLACFTIVGLAAAGLTTRYLLPRLIPTGNRDYGEMAALGRLWSAMAALPRLKWLAPMLFAACAVILATVPGPMWQNDLGSLTPVPRPLLARDAALRKELGAPDARYLVLLESDSADSVVRGLEILRPKLDALIDSGAITGYDHVARYLPSIATQERRQAALPGTAQLTAALGAALPGLPFKAGLFEPFIDDVARARELAPLTPQDLAGSPLELRVGGLLTHRSNHWTGLVIFSGVRHPEALAQLAAASNGSLTLLDLKQAAEDLVAHQRSRILASLTVATVLLLATIWIALRSAQRMGRVVAPMILTTVIILAVLHACGVALNLFHLIALVLAAGLGVDYALFFEAVADEPLEQRRTLHAVLVCSLSTLMVFVLLASSTLPVLRAIGVTVSIGVVSNFVLALLLTRSPLPRIHARA
jgi:predicted exporter